MKIETPTCVCVCDCAVVDPNSQQQECVSLSMEVLGVLNTCNPQGGSCGALLEALLDWLQSSPSSVLLMPLLQGACRCLAALGHMARVVEACMDSHFKRQGQSGLPLVLT